MNGRELCGRFYAEAVRPLLGNLRHSAGLFGSGSEVLGFDDETSTDHHFGPRVLLFVDAADIDQTSTISTMLAAGLPKSFAGVPTNFTDPDPNDHGTQQPALTDGPVNHRVEIHTVAGWSIRYLGFDATRALSVNQWLDTPTQLLATSATAAVYHDGLGQLHAMQERLAWYPDDVWRYILAAQWRRISQEEHFVGRTASVGDELGSRLLAGRLACDLMKLAFVLERTYAPYVKWMGTAFRRLSIANELRPALDAAVAATNYRDREAGLVSAYETAMRVTNQLGLTTEVDPTVRPFFGRGFLVTMGERFSDALRDAITDPDVVALPPHRGAIDQYVDSTDVLSHQALLQHVVNPGGRAPF